MRVSYGKTLAAGLTLAVLAGAGAGLPTGARAEVARQEPSLGPPRHFSADLTVRHRRVTPSGVPIGLPRPDVIMRVVREERRGRWVTSLSASRLPDALVAGPRGTSTLVNPFLVARVEMADDEEQPQLFDRRGQRVRAVSAADLQLVGAARVVQEGAASGRGRSPAGALLAEAGTGGELTRRRELERRFGPATGRVRGLDRYVATTSDARHEVLVKPDTVLPVELLTSSSGRGEMRTGVTYDAHGRHGYVRRLLRTEHHLAEAGAGRAVTEVELANIVMSDEVRR